MKTIVTLLIGLLPISNSQASVLLTLTPEPGRAINNYLIDDLPYSSPMSVSTDTFKLTDISDSLYSFHDISFLENLDMELQVAEFRTGNFFYLYEDIALPVMVPVHPIPEPSTLALGLVGLALVIRRYR